MLLLVLEQHVENLSAWCDGKFANTPTVEMADKLLACTLSVRSEHLENLVAALRAGAVLPDYSTETINSFLALFVGRSNSAEVIQLVVRNTENRGTSQQLIELIFATSHQPAVFQLWSEAEWRTRDDLIAYIHHQNQSGKWGYAALKGITKSSLLTGDDLNLVADTSAVFLGSLLERDDLPQELAINVVLDYGHWYHRFFDGRLPSLPASVENFEILVERLNAAGKHHTIFQALQVVPKDFDASAVIGAQAGLPAHTVAQLSTRQRPNNQVIEQLVNIVVAVGSADLVLSMAHDWSGSFDELRAVLMSVNSHRAA
jgi:hypothetical protein